MTSKIAIFPTFGKVLKLTFSEIYNSLGYAILVSIIWFIAALPVLFMILANLTFIVKGVADNQSVTMIIPMLVFSLILIAIWNGLVIGPVTSTLYAVHQERKESYIGVKTYLECFKKFYWISARIYWAFSFGITLIIANLFISLVQTGLIFKIGGLLSVYVVLFMMNLPLFFHPLIFYKHNFSDIFRKAFLLVMDNLALTLLLSMLVGLMLAVCAPTVILMVLLFGAFYLIMVDNAFEFISKKYEAQ